MTLSAIHNSVHYFRAMKNVVCDIGGIWLCQLFTTNGGCTIATLRCLWYRGDMTLSAIHNPLSLTSDSPIVVCDIGGIWLCQLFTTETIMWESEMSCLWYRGDMTLSAIHNRGQTSQVLHYVVCDIGGIWLCQLFTTNSMWNTIEMALFVI